MKDIVFRVAIFIIVTASLSLVQLVSSEVQLVSSELTITDLGTPGSDFGTAYVNNDSGQAGDRTTSSGSQVKIYPDLPQRYIIEKVPQIFQGKKECGPVSMNMVLNYWDVTIYKEEIKKAVNWDEEKGTKPREMCRFPESLGFVTDCYSGDIQRIVENIIKDRPVIVRQWLNKKDKQEGKFGHYRVVIGYNLDSKMIYMRDPNKKFGSSELTFEEFLDLWDMTNHHSNPLKNWMLVIYK